MYVFIYASVHASMSALLFGSNGIWMQCWMRLVWNEFNELHDIVHRGRTFHSLIVDRKKTVSKCVR